MSELTMVATSDISSASKDGAEDGEGRECGMKIEHTIKDSQVHLYEIEDGKCFRWFGNYYMNTDKTSMSHWIGGEYKYTMYVVKLEDGHLGELPPETLVTRESAKVVIE